MVLFLWPRRRPSRNATTTTPMPATTRPVLAAPSATSVVSSVTPLICGELRLDVGAGDRLLRAGGGHHPYSFSAPDAHVARQPHAVRAPNSSATNMIRYGTHDQSPVKVSPVSSCSARRPDMARNTTPKPSSSDPSEPEADVAAELLERDEGLLLEVA